MNFSILGAAGTIGRALVAALRAAGHQVHAIDRGGLASFLADSSPAGHVIDCIGLTGDFRMRPLETADAHVGVVANCLRRGGFDSFLYLSSTRVYARTMTTQEDTPLTIQPADASDLYSLTKLAGEALCLSDPRIAVRAVRLSNVYAAAPGADTFLGQIITAGRASGQVELRQAPDSAKDYISLHDVVALLPRIATNGRQRLYNLASGRNTTHATIADILHRALGWDVRFAPDAATFRFPPIDITCLRQDFSPALRDFSSDLRTLASGQEAPCSPSTKPAVA